MTAHRGTCAFGTWERVVAAPHPALSASVLGYVGLDSRLKLLRELHLPSGEAALVVNLGAPYRVIDSASGEARHHANASVMGVHDRHFFTACGGSKRLLVVRLAPSALHALVGLDMDALTNRWVALDALDGGFSHDVADAIDGTRSWSNLFRAMDTLLTTRLTAETISGDDASWAWRELRRRDGRVKIGPLADTIGCSRRHLIANFRTRVGLTPKTAAQLMRFNRVLRAHPVDALGADAAIACGYADQPHMIREFGRFAGAPPIEIARRVAGFTLRG